MDRVYLRHGGSRAVKLFRHVLVPPTFAQQHAMRMHLDAEHYLPSQYDRAVEEETGDAFAVNDRDMGEQVPCLDEAVMEELEGGREGDLFDSIRAAPPDPIGEAVAVRGDIPWDCGEHPALGKGHNNMSHNLHKHCMQPRSPRSKSPRTLCKLSAMICCRDISSFSWTFCSGSERSIGAEALRYIGHPRMMLTYRKISTHWICSKVCC